MGRALLARGIDLVFGGGRVGLMGVLADTVLAGGGQVFGVIPAKLQELELGHDGCTELFVVDTMHTRKQKMARLADGFVALPGGYGTLEELFEVTTWTQLEYHRKPVGLLNVHGYYDHLVAWIAHAAERGFVRPVHRRLINVHADPAALLDAMAAQALPEVRRWV
jgi:uncharacterized protein (TIGR00730 family)